MKQKKSKKKSLTLPFSPFISFLILFLFTIVCGLFAYKIFFFSKPLPVIQKSVNIGQLDKELSEVVARENPKVALKKLHSLLSNDEIANSCHGIAHDIGHEAFTKYRDFNKAMEYNDEVCGSGYIHGLVEARMEKVTDLSQDLTTICAPTNSGICFPGVGHGFMYYTINNVPVSLASCDTLGEAYKINNCYDGVFMENYEGNKKLHPSKYVDEVHPSYPCNELQASYKESCYFYSVRYYLQLHPRNYTDAFAWCRTQEEGYRLTCIKGVGSAIMKQNLNESHVAAAICNKTESGDEIAYCIDGMVSYYVTNTYSLSATESMCEEIAEKNKAQCMASVNARRTLFPN